MTATEARERYGGRHVEVHRYGLSDDRRANADGATAGALVLVTAKDRLVGVSALSPCATEIVHELALAIGIRLKLTDLADTVHISSSYADGIGRIVDERSRRTTRRTRTLVRMSRWFG